MHVVIRSLTSANESPRFTIDYHHELLLHSLLVAGFGLSRREPTQRKLRPRNSPIPLIHEALGMSRSVHACV